MQRSSLNFPGLTGADAVTRYHRIRPDSEAPFVQLFIEAHERAPAEIVLDLDATDDPVACPPA